MKPLVFELLQMALLCALCGFLFYTGHPTAGGWMVVTVICNIATVSVKSTGDKQ